MSPRGPRIGVLALGEAHQLLHVLGPAAALVRRGADVELMTATAWHERLVARHAPEAAAITRRLAGFRARGPIHAAPGRLRLLLANARRLARFDVLLTPELTTTLLRRAGLFRGLLAVVPHGAGDRAVTYDPRYAEVDLVLAPGEKLRAGLIARAMVGPEACVVTGYPKFDLLDAPPPRFFDDDRPVVLYNPHFRQRLSSWPAMGPALIAALREAGDFNVILAPHIRASGGMRRQIEALAAVNETPGLHVDPGSEHSVNMDYTRAADIYLGDASSQVYEFLLRPRPCVFLDPRGRDRTDDPHLRHWRFGEVARDPQAALACLRRARARHPLFLEAQHAGFAESISAAPAAASERVADALCAAWRRAGRARAPRRHR